MYCWMTDNCPYCEGELIDKPELEKIICKSCGVQMSYVYLAWKWLGTTIP